MTDTMPVRMMLITDGESSLLGWQVWATPGPLLEDEILDTLFTDPYLYVAKRSWGQGQIADTVSMRDGGFYRGTEMTRFLTVYVEHQAQREARERSS